MCGSLRLWRLTQIASSSAGLLKTSWRVLVLFEITKITNIMRFPPDVYRHDKRLIRYRHRFNDTVLLSKINFHGCLIFKLRVIIFFTLANRNLRDKWNIVLFPYTLNHRYNYHFLFPDDTYKQTARFQSARKTQT
jgi:hypothetical protein